MIHLYLRLLFLKAACQWSPWGDCEAKCLKNGSEPEKVTGIRRRTVEKEGLFDVSVNKLLSVEQLQPETVFQCFLTIPGTQYSVREETMYFPDRGKCRFFSSSE